MTPKEKAEEIWLCYYELIDDIYSNEAAKELAKKYSLIAVDELIDSHLLLTTTHDSKPSIRCKRYWQEVKKEIELL
jgi:hypothetical protein